MAGYVQLKGFRPSTDRAEQDVEYLFGARFKATRVWNDMLERFHSGMPLKRHRRQIRIFDDCFTGREAVDFLMNELPKFIHDGREITRSSCSKLLDIYLSMGLFCGVRRKLEENEQFKENELYRFARDSLDRLAATPILVRRAASFNERYSFGNTPSKGKDFGFTGPQRMHTSGWKNWKKESFAPARMAIPAMHSNAPLSRRLSASHGNLTSLLNPEKLDDVPAEKLTVRAILKKTEFKQETDLTETASKHVEAKPETSGQIRALDDVIVELAKLNSVDSSHASSTQNLRHFGKVIQAESPQESCPSPGAVVNEKHSGVNLFIDSGEIYKNFLMKRLKSVLQVDSLKGIFEYDFNGKDVQWNCEQVGAKGIVQVTPDSDYLSNYVITMMRYLSRWPFDTKFADSTRVPYEGFELNVFKSICEQFDKDCPILPSVVAVSVLNILRLFRQRVLHKQGSTNSCMETVFCVGNSPVTRYVTGNAKPRKQIKPDSKDEIMQKAFPVAGEFFEAHLMSPPNITHSSLSTLSAGSDNMSGRMAYEAILTRLPGLQRSPELMERIEELAKTNTLMPRSSTPCSESSPLLAGVRDGNEKALKEAISLVLLTLEPRVRRRLHYLLRFMQRVSRNYCLRMDKRRTNRSIVLEGLCCKILKTSQVINASDGRQLIVFLMDNESDVFALPNIFISDVKQQISQQHEIIRKKSPAAQHIIEEKPLSSERLKAQFCEPIRLEEYESQKKDVNCHLLDLLDGILHDENLSLAERKQKLKKFKKTYPEIYAQKFPSPGLSKPRLIDRIRSFHF